MARTRTLLKLLARVWWRRQKSFSSVAGNNFFIVTALLLQEAGVFLYFLVFLVLLFPLSADPMRQVPRSRVALWPIRKREWWAVRVLSPWLSPASWIVLGLGVWAAAGRVSARDLTLDVAVLAGVFLVSAWIRPSSGGVGIWLPSLPGRWNQMIRKNLREMLCVLDLYIAALVSLATVVYRVTSGGLERPALVSISVLIAVALSTYAQCLFGLEPAGSLARYRLMPVRGWEVLAAKDLALLLVTVLLTLPIAPVEGLAAGLMALAIGHAPSVLRHAPQTRWRFFSSPSVVLGIGQAIAMGICAFGVASDRLLLAPCVLMWVGSLVYYGRRLE